ncbi:MAG: iron-sulfur cluster assembly accessory protein [Magnetococcales bacterium]|nr:iron-sulfur cluster assembly accessory protein [Magnetococcales bacterium]
MSETEQAVVTLTEKAAVRVRQMLEKRGTPQAALRIGVATAGCSGLSYKLEYADAPEEGDRAFESQGIRLVVDGKSLVYLMGLQMDFVNDPFRSGFKFTNPNEKERCGCGESFKV